MLSQGLYRGPGSQISVGNLLRYLQGVNLGNWADKRVLIECWVLPLGNAGCYYVMNNRC